MTTVTESYPLPMRPWWTMLPRRSADTPVSLAAETLPRQPAQASKEWGPGGPGGAGLRTCPSSPPTGCSYFPPSPNAVFPRLSVQPMETWGLVSMAMMLSLILRWWMVPLPFTWIYIYIWTDTVRGPLLPFRGHRRCPEGLMQVERDDECCRLWFYLSNRNVSACFDLLFNTFCRWNRKVQ